VRRPAVSGSRTRSMQNDPLDLSDFGGGNPNVPDDIKEYSDRLRERALKISEVDPKTFQKAWDRVHNSRWGLFKRTLKQMWENFKKFFTHSYRKRQKIKAYSAFISKAETSNFSTMPVVPLHELMFEIDKEIQNELKRHANQH
jgi:hypothetical protein